MKYFVVLSIFIFFYCAHRTSPTGGPVDETPPFIISSIPESGVTNYPANKKITLFFSEWVDIKKTEKSITVFPTLNDGFKIAVFGKKIEIVPNTELAESTTFHVGINTMLTDLHGVSIGVPYDLFFSTGPYIDSGSVQGCIIEKDTYNIQPKVALFRCGKEPSPDSLFINTPDYLTQTDSLGVFTFTHIRRGTYEILAFIDSDNNNRLTPGKETGYAPNNRRFVVEKEIDLLSLFPIITDTTTLIVDKIKAISQRVIQGEWKSGNKTMQSSNDYDHEWRIISLDSTIKAPKVDKYIRVENSPQFILKLSENLTLGSYSLIYKLFPVYKPLFDSLTFKDSTQNIDTSYLDTIRFNGTNYADTTRPEYKRSSLSDKFSLDTEINFTWSKPVRFTPDNWFVIDSLNDSIECRTNKSFSHTTVFRPIIKLYPDRHYRISIPIALFEDFVGNTPFIKIDTTKKTSKKRKRPVTGPKYIYPKFQSTTKIIKRDSIDGDTVNKVTMNFTTTSGLKLCYSLSGKASCLKPDKKRIWEFQLFGSGTVYESHDSSSNFRFDSIPAGKGSISFFMDYNGDSTYTKGSLFPWIPPEPYYSFSDTIEARARWDIVGIEIPACNICKSKIEDSKKRGSDFTEVIDTSINEKNLKQNNKLRFSK